MFWFPQLWSHFDNISTTVLTPTILISQNLSIVFSKTIISHFVKHFLLERTLSEHLESMKKPFVWGTQVELQAAAD